MTDRVWYDLRTLELGQLVVLDVDVMTGKPFPKADALVRSVIAAFGREPVGGDLVIARRQAAELDAIRRMDGLLERALRLTLRTCQPTTCFEPATQTTAETFTHPERFDPRNALIVEHRFSGLASPEGDVESSAAGTAP